MLTMSDVDHTLASSSASTNNTNGRVMPQALDNNERTKNPKAMTANSDIIAFIFISLCLAKAAPPSTR